MTDDRSAPPGSPDQPDRGADPAPEHADDGLDLARRAARAAAGAGRKAGPRRSRRSASGDAGRTPRGSATGAHPDERDPQLLDTSVERLVADRGWELDLRVQGVFGRWAELVGPEVAGHSTPESLTEGRLLVRTDSTAWATQLRFLAPTVVRRLNQELGHGTVTLLEVVGPAAPSWKKGPRSVRGGRGPRDTYG